MLCEEKVQYLERDVREEFEALARIVSSPMPVAGRRGAIRVCYNCSQKGYECSVSEIILGSQYRRKILGLFFLNEDKGYYQRQLERELGIPIGNVGREVKTLEEEGVLTREHFGNLVLFKVNRRYPLYEEFKRIVLKTAGVVPRLRQALGQAPEITLAFIFGSYAHGRWTEASDVDLLVVGRLRRSDLKNRLEPVQRDLGRAINSTLYSEDEALRKLKAGDGFLMEVLGNPIIPVKEISGKRAKGDSVLVTESSIIRTLTRKGQKNRGSKRD